MNEDQYWMTEGICHACGHETTRHRDTCYACYLALREEILRLNEEYALYRRGELLGMFSRLSAKYFMLLRQGNKKPLLRR